MKRKYMVKDKNAEPYSAANACQELMAPFVYVQPADEFGGRPNLDVFLTEPSKGVIDALVAGGFEVINQRGERCVEQQQ